MTRNKKKNSESPESKTHTGTSVDSTRARPTRRHFLWTLWTVLGGVVVLEIVAVAMSFFRPRRSRSGSDDGSIVIAGPIERFETNSVTAFPQGKFYLTRLENGGFLAMSRECTHLGCTVPWDSASMRFVCPCHASSFDIAGNVLSPPAPRALDIHPVRIENGIVKVDTSRRIKRRTFDPGQVTFS